MVRSLGPRKVQNGASRQRPVSCQFCRARKLKCNRQLPCGNCISRGIACQLYSQPAASESVTDQEVLQRLRRLEDIVLRSPWQTAHVADALACTTPAAPPYHQASTEVKRLEQECMSQDPSETIQPDRVTFKICSIQHEQGARAPVASGNGDHCRKANGSFERSFCLPRCDEARVLLDKYVRDITYIHHVIHIPTVRTVVNGIYEDLRIQKQPKPNHVVLLYSIVASSIYSWTEQDVDLPFCRNGQDATEKSAPWVKSALDLLDYLRRASSKSLEEIQAIIIISFVVCHLEGPSARHRDLITSAITAARELGIHKIDLPDLDATEENLRDPVVAEVCRRAWWYLVSTDWMFSQYTGPLKGTYTVNPRHMVINKPRNVDDTDLVPSLTTIPGQSLNHPTNVSYNLQRIQLAEICRELTDSMPLASTGAVEYAHVLKFDRSIIGFMAQWPPFFRLEEEEQEGDRHKPSRPRPEHPAHDDPDTATQRYILNSIVPAQRCRLHLPYLTRASLDPAYAYSRDACLDAARHILRAERLLAMQDLPFVRMRQRHSGTLQCICMAIIALLADTCFCRGVGGREEQQRRAELVDACGILDRAKSESPLAGRLLGYFGRVMREHDLGPASQVDEDRMGHGVVDSADGGSMEGPEALDLSDQLTRWEESLWPWDGMDTELDWDAIISGLNPLI